METPSPKQIELRLRELGPAPRLFASAADWAALPKRLETDPVAAAIYRETRKRADALLAGSLLEHKKIGRRRLASAREFERRILDLATVARVESDPRYAARAREELLATLTLPDWGPNHFLDIAEYSLGVAVGLDWLHDSLSPAERDLLAQALIDRAIRPTFSGPSPSLKWLGGKSNWTQVCHSGLTAAALAVADREPALAARTIARAIKEQSGPAGLYAPDGVYPEGPMYWGYGTTFEVILSTLLTRSFGTDYGLADYPGFLASPDFLTQVTGPTGTYFNYSDSREEVSSHAVLHWFAARRNEPAIAGREVKRLDEKPPTETGKDGKPVLDRYAALALWWHEPAGLDVGTAPHLLPRNWLGRGKNPVAVFRSAWNDPRATYLAIKGGSPSGSHAHMDAGSFVLEADGVRWAVDPGMQEYETLESIGVKLWDASQEGARWDVFRLGPDAHNILRFNDARQRVKSEAKIVDFVADGTTPHVTLDLSDLYDDQSASVRRGVSLLPDRRVVIQDEWTAGKQPLEVAWQWLTHASVTVQNQAILLTEPGATLRLRIQEPNTVKIVVDDVSKPHPSDMENPGLHRIRVLIKSAAGKSGRLVIIAEPGSVIATGDEPVKALSKW